MEGSGGRPGGLERALASQLRAASDRRTKDQLCGMSCTSVLFACALSCRPSYTRTCHECHTVHGCHVIVTLWGSCYDCHVTCHIMIVMSHVTGVMSHLTYGANHCYCVVCLVCWHCTYQWGLLAGVIVCTCTSPSVCRLPCISVCCTGVGLAPCA